MVPRYKITTSIVKVVFVADQPSGTPQEKTIPRANWGNLVYLFARGYKAISGNEIIAIIKELKGRYNKINTDKSRTKERPTNASLGEIVPFAIGLFKVLVTFESISLSQRSLIMHPAPLIKIDPIVKSNINFIDK